MRTEDLMVIFAVLMIAFAFLFHSEREDKNVWREAYWVESEVVICLYSTEDVSEIECLVDDKVESLD